jgi:DNA-binding HxlR family transcriptional regulator
MPAERSKCPIAQVLDIVGDRWTLLVIRDIAAAGKTSFGEFSTSAEIIPPSTLSDRLERLLEYKMITKTRVAGGPGRQYRYGLTERGADLIPVLVAMTQWSAKHVPDTAISPTIRKQLKADSQGIIATLRAPWLSKTSA